MDEKKLKLYGTNWCTKSANLRNYLQSIWVEFEDYNVETQPEADEAVRSLYDGQLKFPTVTYGEDFLKNPTIPEIDAFLDKHGLKE
ncbi:glutaredoxin family protein [Flagellimonas meridianipacifica]|uniref:Glutaredoxin n=1 Tax=Flagellimonas meridianipacifica TaxID=1080225 RepID=A0A2T0MJ30_9FLAO|nr:glutaredoxin domain-containing protein [Allomuricauda pacifica]PRX57598.1 glutaredoxin [Allomuricauda pacifica]